MNKVYIVLGSNLGDRKEYLDKAINQISIQVGEILEQSSVYSTAPWGFESDNYFYNQVICIQCNLEFDHLMNSLLEIEAKLGRERDVKSETYQSRTIDIDVLMIDQNIYSSKILTVPHPRMTERKFVLEPLNEIAPALIFPINGKSINDLFVECKDESQVYKV